jgi:hypothetical protein
LILQPALAPLPGVSIARKPFGWMDERVMAILLLVLAVLVVLQGIALLYLLFRPSPPAPTTPTAVATRAPGVTGTPAPQDVLYQANWANNSLDGWTVDSKDDKAGDWLAQSGELVNNGSNSADIGTAPSIQAPSGTLRGLQAYAIEATIEVLGYAGGPGFGFFVGYNGGASPTGYIVGVSSSSSGPLSQLHVTTATGWHTPALQTVDFYPGSSAHTYRIEVRGKQISLFVDGAALLVPPLAADSLGGVIVGLWSVGTRLVVSSFALYKLG